MRKTRLNVFVTKAQETWLRQESEFTGLAVSDITRRAIGEYIIKRLKAAALKEKGSARAVDTGDP